MKVEQEMPEMGSSGWERKGKIDGMQMVSLKRWDWGANYSLTKNKRSKLEKYMLIKRNQYTVYKTLLKLELLTNLYNKNEKIYNKTLTFFSYRKEWKWDPWQRAIPDNFVPFKHLWIFILNKNKKYFKVTLRHYSQAKTYPETHYPCYFTITGNWGNCRL